ncbi:MAG: amino acid ABC transporter permease [Desulfuromonas sp.]|nr:MAG: amino acid ABC transporter permease [Desulfuromonas sp.]
MHLFSPPSRGLNRLDLVLSFAVGALVAWCVYRLQVVLDYDWHWETIPRYLLRRDADGGWVPNLLLQGLLTTVRLSVWSMLLATLFGFGMGVFRASPRLLRRLCGQFYVGLVRNLPPLVLVFIFYFFLSGQLMPLLGVERLVRGASPEVQSWMTLLFAPPGLMVEFISAVLTLALFEGAYITEIVRAGIQSLEQGQWDGARALGMTRYQQLRWVILPQALQRILPPLGGQFISTIKDSAIVSVISIQELTFQGMEVMATTYLTLEVWLTVSLLYFLLTFSCSLGVRRLELLGQRR